MSIVFNLLQIASMKFGLWDRMSSTPQANTNSSTTAFDIEPAEKGKLNAFFSVYF